MWRKEGGEGGLHREGCGLAGVMRGSTFSFMGDFLGCAMYLRPSVVAYFAGSFTFFPQESIQFWHSFCVFSGVLIVVRFFSRVVAG